MTIRSLILLFALLVGCTTANDPDLASAEEFQAEIDTAKAAVDLPPGATWPRQVDVSDPDASYERGGGRSQVEGVAFCLWSKAWLAAEADGAAQQRATEVLVAVPQWELYKGPFADQSFRDVLDGVIDGVRSGNRQPVFEFWRVNCEGL